MKKRILASLMCLCMLVGLMPTAFAAEGRIASSSANSAAVDRTLARASGPAQVGGTIYETLDQAFAALDETNYSLTLLDETAWTEDNIYWQTGTENGYADSLRAAVEAASRAEGNAITLICKPDAEIADSSAHINVTKDVTIYANGAKFSGDDLAIGTYVAPAKIPTTINIYCAKNLVVWGNPVANREDIWNVNFVDCENDGWNLLMYRGDENGGGKINLTLTRCKASGYNDSTIHTSADGSIKITECTFENNCAPVNIAHKQAGTMEVMIENSSFTGCGSTSTANNLNQYAAPIRFVNNGSGILTAVVDAVTITNTVGENGDILLGDGRTGKASKDVTLTVTSTAANVQAQKPGYYNAGTPDVTKMMAVAVTEKDTLTTSVSELLPNVAKIGEVEYATLKEALDSLKKSTEETATIQLLADQNVSGFTVDLSGSKIESLTIQGNGKKLDSLVENGDQNGERDGPRLPVIDVKMKDGANLVVDNAVFPNSLIFDDTTSKASVTIQNCTFRKAQAGYPKAKEITYDHNTFDFNGDLEKKTGTGGDLYYTHNAYPLWFIVEQSQKIALTNNTVTKYPRGFHIQTRNDALGEGIVVNNNTFNLVQCCKDHHNKRVALQLAGKLNGNVEFQNNNVNAYIGVCFFKDISVPVETKPTLTIQNNYTAGKLYGSSEWNTNGATEADRIAAADKFAQELVEGAGSDSTVTEGHTHNYVDGTCTICGQDKPSSGGGSSSYAITLDKKVDNGTVTLSHRNASRNTTVTITVKADKGYELDELTVTDKSGKEIKLTDKGNGKYTFSMPAFDVTVKASFQLVGSDVKNPFTDVTKKDYFYQPVLWALDQGITAGTSATTFGPHDSCTRAQMVTFLWRAAGSPVVDYAMDFTDVPANAYYTEAVRWAVSKGITAGTGEGTFSPDATVSRCQSITFLWRAAGSPVVNYAMNFTDVPANAYYTEAVRWAVSEGITAGVGNAAFGPDLDCTRGQIMTFLYQDMMG